MNKIKKIIAICLSMMIIISSFTMAFAENDEKNMDVDSSSIELDIIQLLEIMNGNENGNLNLNSNVTRSEFIKMAITASEYKDNVVKDSNLSIFSDVKSTNWAAGYVKLAVDNGWVTGYLDGTFKPDNSITLEEGVTVILKMLGYESSDLTGAFPYAQLNKFSNLNLDENVSAKKGEKLTRLDCVNIFYNLLTCKNKENVVYGSKLSATDENGKINYNELLDNNLSKGFIYKSNLYKSIPFDLNSAKVYLNGKKSSLAKINVNDVIYYCKNLKKIYAYSEKKVGEISEIINGTFYPTKIVISGTTYNINDDELSRKIVDEYKYVVGDSVIIITGINNEVVDIQRVGNTSLTNIGIVKSSTSKVNNGISEYLTEVCGIDGSKSSYSSSKKFNEGDTVLVSTKNGKVDVSKIYKSGKNIKYSELANSVNILDVKDNLTKVVYKSRLKDVNLDSANVIYYEMDSSNKVCKLILDDVTKDFETYGIVIDKNEIKDGFNISSSYTLLTVGVEKRIGSDNAIYNVDEAEVCVTFKNEKLENISALAKIDITDLNDNNAISGSESFKFTDEMQVYLRSNGEYHLTTISEIMKSDDLKIEAYVNQNALIPNEIRIIIAK